jgi:tetratricopeptide (TPR) repeat protein
MADLKAAMRAARDRRAATQESREQETQVFEPPSRVRASELRSEGNARFAAGDVAGAEASYDAALALPNLSSADASLLWSNKALLAMHRGKWENARSACDKAITLDARNVKACYRRAVANEKMLRYDDAHADVVQVIAEFAEDTPEGQQARALQARLPRNVQKRETEPDSPREVAAPELPSLKSFDIPAMARAEGWGVMDDDPPPEEPVVPEIERPFDSRCGIPEGSDYFKAGSGAAEAERLISAPPREDSQFVPPPLPDFCFPADEPEFDFLTGSGRKLGEMPLLIDEDNLPDAADVVDDEEETEEDKAAAKALFDFCTRKKEKDDRMAKWRERWGD